MYLAKSQKSLTRLEGDVSREGTSSKWNVKWNKTCDAKTVNKSEKLIAN